MPDDVFFTEKGHLGLITLNRPNALNALTLPMIKAMYRQLVLWEKNPEIAAVVLQAAAGKAFCAGGDIRWLYETGKANNPQLMEFFVEEYRLNHFIYQFPKPYIALMDGITMGGGVGIVLHGSYPIASERFIFAMPETSIGFFPDIGASYLLARCPDNLGIYLGLTGNRLQAFEALAAGLVKYVIDGSLFPQLVDQLCAMDLSHEPEKQIMACLQRIARKEELPENPFEFSQNFAKSRVEDILDSLKSEQKKEADDIHQTLSHKAPLSLKITLEQIRKAKTLSLAECLKMDYILVGHFMQDHDFYEGVRALLIDKDKSPQWQPAQLSLVTEAMVANYFERQFADNLHLSM